MDRSTTAAQPEKAGVTLVLAEAAAVAAAALAGCSVRPEAVGRVATRSWGIAAGNGRPRSRTAGTGPQLAVCSGGRESAARLAPDGASAQFDNSSPAVYQATGSGPTVFIVMLR